MYAYCVHLFIIYILWGLDLHIINKTCKNIICCYLDCRSCLMSTVKHDLRYFVIKFFYSLSFLFVTASIPIPKSDRITEARSAHQKFETSTPGARKPASINKRAFTTKLNKPNVKKLTGIVKKFKSGRKKALISEIITTKTKADKNPETEIPGSIHAINKTANANKIHLTSTIII